MANKNIWLYLGIGVVAFMLLTQMGTKEIKKQAGEGMERELSDSFVHPSDTFTVKYNVLGFSVDPFFFSIKDTLTGGCTVFGSSEIVTTLTSPQTETGAMTVTAPGSIGYCYFDGDYQLGSEPIVNFPQGSVRICNLVDCVQSAWAPLSTTVCPAFGYTQTRSVTTAQDCGGVTCGPSSQGATGNKDCGTTPSITVSDTFANGCNGGTAGTCNSCYTYGDGFSGSCVKDINACTAGVDRTELGCVAAEWVGGPTTTLRRYLGDSAQDWINNGGPA